MNNISGLFPKNKKTVIIIGLIVFGLILALGFGSGGEEVTADGETLDEYKIRMEKELGEFCSSLKGVGKCEVTLSFSKGAEKTYKGDKLIESRPPSVVGVAIACRGADSASVRESLTELFTSLFGIQTNRIAILRLN